VLPGRTATYSITVWTTRAASKDTTVGIKVKAAAHVGSPQFTGCPSASGATCSLGNLPVGQADDLLASVGVGGQAAPGEHVELIGDASATGAASARSSATVLVGQRGAPSPSPSNQPAGGVGDPAMAPLAPFPFIMTAPPVTLPDTPVGITLTDPSLVFPKVSPSSPPSAQSRSHASHVKLDTNVAYLAPGPWYKGAQLTGVIALAAAIAITIALARMPRPGRRPGNGGKRPGQKGGS
jgi:hypothetical protein